MRGWNPAASSGVPLPGTLAGLAEPLRPRNPLQRFSNTRLPIPRRTAPHPKRTPNIDAKELAAAAAALCDQKKGEDIQVIEVLGRLKIADYFVVATGTSRAHVRALYDEVHARLKAAGASHPKAEGIDLGWWIVLDYGDVVVHFLQPDARGYYEIERLYGDCPRLDWTRVALPELPEARVARA